MPIKLPEIIECSSMSDNQTFNNCPDCGKYWQTIPPIPGIIHQTVRCDKCREELKNE